MALIATSDLLTLKKTIYAANLGEDDVANPEGNRHYLAVKKLAEEEGSQVLPICAKLEADIAELGRPRGKGHVHGGAGHQASPASTCSSSAATPFWGLSPPHRRSDECRAWTIKKGTKAPQAAGKIHTDFERGFIRAEVIAFEDLKACGSLAMPAPRDWCAARARSM